MTTQEFLLSIFASVIASFIFAGIVWGSSRWRQGPKPSQQSFPEPAPIKDPGDDFRAHNRQRLEHAFFGFMFYLVTFMVLYFSIAMPPLFKAMFSKEAVLLSQARLIGPYLPEIQIGKEMLQAVFLVIAMIAYLPLLKLAELIFSLLYPLIDWLTQITPRKRAAFTMLTFLALCVPVSATSVWMYTQKSYGDSMITVLVAMAIAFAIGQGQNRR